MKLSKAARLGKQTNKICLVSLVIILGYFVTRTVSTLIFSV